MLRFETAGESHGECLVATLTGLPAGIPISIDSINHELWRRQQGFGRGGRMKIETDRAEVVSGVRHSKTIGSPIAVIIRNTDWKNWTENLPVEGGDPALRKAGDASAARSCRPGRRHQVRLPGRPVHTRTCERSRDDGPRRHRRAREAIPPTVRHRSAEPCDRGWKRAAGQAGFMGRGRRAIEKDRSAAGLRRSRSRSSA